MLSKYKKLLKGNEYDKEKVEEFAQLLNDAAELEAQFKQMRELIRENQELQEFTWRTADGTVLALHQIEDSHLINIMNKYDRSAEFDGWGEEIPLNIRREAMKRGIEIPNTKALEAYIDGECE